MYRCSLGVDSGCLLHTHSLIFNFRHAYYIHSVQQANEGSGIKQLGNISIPMVQLGILII